MEDKKVIKNEKQKGHKLSKEFEKRMAYECINIHEVKEETQKQKS